MNQVFYTGVCEDRRDGLMLGRVRVRVVGIHSADKSLLPTSSLPWANVMMPANNGSISGIGWSPTGILPGTWCVVVFLDENQQIPLVIGTLLGIPQTASAKIASDNSNGAVTTDMNGDLVSGAGDVLTDIISAIVDNTSPSDGEKQSEGERFQVNAITKQLSDGTSKTTYNVVDTEGTEVYATATFDETTQLYSVSLLNAENYTKEQYTPFSGGAKPVTFETTQAVVDYFDLNF